MDGFCERENPINGFSDRGYPHDLSETSIFSSGNAARPAARLLLVTVTQPTWPSATARPWWYQRLQAASSGESYLLFGDQWLHQSPDPTWWRSFTNLRWSIYVQPQKYLVESSSTHLRVSGILKPTIEKQPWRSLVAQPFQTIFRRHKNLRVQNFSCIAG